jgi:hypothetical protein
MDRYYQSKLRAAHPRRDIAKGESNIDQDKEARNVAIKRSELSGLRRVLAGN